jgi:hypothetical protein
MDDIVWLLGAGASKDAGLPLAPELTEQVLDAFESAPDKNMQRQHGSPVLNYVVSAIVGRRGRQDGTSPRHLPDIETVASAIELLSNREDVELAPFIQTWDPGVEHYARTVWAGGPGAYTALLSEMMRVLAELLAITDSAAVSYLDPLVALGNQASGVTIATLNYDRSVEVAAEASNIPCALGLENLDATGDLQLPGAGVRLIKLHGSIDWPRGTWWPDPNQGSFGVQREAVDWADTSTDKAPFIIFGRRE